MLVAHRGMSSHAPENTIAAAKTAIEAGADIVECDVHLTKDGRAVVMHDLSLQRTTNSRAMVSDLDSHELAKLDAGSWFHPAFSDQRVPMLTDLIRLVNKRAKLLIEIKPSRIEFKPSRAGGLVKLHVYGGLAECVLADVKAANAESWCIVQSFAPAYLQTLKSLQTQMELQLLVMPQEIICGWGAVDRPELRALVKSMNLWHYRCTEAMVRGLHERGFKVLAWTVDDAATMRKCLQNGVDGLITNSIETAKLVLAEAHGARLFA